MENDQTSSRVPKVRIIHETNPKKYFPALFQLHEEKKLTLVGHHRYSVVKEWLRSWKNDRTPFIERTINAIGDLKLRLKIPFIKDEVVVLGFAPWDFRLLLFSYLARNNRIIYHTSWPDWRLENVPRRFFPFNGFLRKRWSKFLSNANVEVVSVTDQVAETVWQEMGKSSIVIPHAVPNCFFQAKVAVERRSDGPLRLLYVGEISEKKGIKRIIELQKSPKQNQAK